MITLLTGQPGTTKTLNLLKLINEDDLYKNRPIYYFNIRELKLPWEELTKEQVLSWFTLPEHSVIVIDECQRFFPPRKTGSSVPDCVQYFDTHRHSGYDIFLVTQHPTLIDATLRKFVGRHLHFERPFGFSRYKRFEWQKCISDVDNFHQRKEAILINRSFDKKYYDLYKSSEVHTHKAKVPPKLIMVIGLIVLAFSMLAFFINKKTTSVNAEETEKPSEGVVYDAEAFANFDHGRKHKQVTTKEFIELRKPRVAGLPHTAPHYDQLTKPTRVPIPQCVLNESKNRCKCYTQQATTMIIPHNTCVSIVKNGLFIDFDVEKRNKRNDREERQLAASRPRLGSRSKPSNVSFIPYEP